MWTETMPYDSSSVLAMNQADRQFGGAMLAHMMIQWPEGRAFPDRQTLLAAADIHALFNKHAGFSGPFSIRNVLATVPGNDLQERYQLLRSRANDTSQMLISEPDRTLLVSARVPNDGSHALGQRLDELQQDLNLLRQKYPDFKFTLTGTAVAAAENMSAIIVDLVRSLMIAAVLIVFVLAVAFRSIKIGLLTVVPNALPLLITAAGLTLLGMPLQITAALTFSLCLGLAVDDTIHVLVRYQMNRDLHPDNTRLAIEQTVHHVGPALLVTTAILLAGFIAMLVSPMPGIRLFALLSSVTLISALIGDLLFFPAILLWGLKRKLPEA
jgi:predicted RND superfamily exporter protein